MISKAHWSSIAKWVRWRLHSWTITRRVFIPSEVSWIILLNNCSCCLCYSTWLINCLLNISTTFLYNCSPFIANSATNNHSKDEKDCDWNSNNSTHSKVSSATVIVWSIIASIWTYNDWGNGGTRNKACTDNWRSCWNSCNRLCCSGWSRNWSKHN